MDAGHDLLSSTHQHHHNTGMQHFHSDKWQGFIPLVKTYHLKKSVRNSRDGSLLKKKVLPHSFSSTVSNEQTEENKWRKQKVSSWENVPELSEGSKSKIFFQ